jgi:hypothetical protein
MYLVSFPTILVVSIIRVIAFLFLLTFLSSVQAVLSVVVSANTVIVFRFLVYRYCILFGTTITVCVDY